jgi:RNA polymerase sigma-70 factor (ECF subfamily)
LPDVQADALRLRFFGGLKYEEIAQSMNSSVSGAKRRVRRGLLSLTKALSSFD